MEPCGRGATVSKSTGEPQWQKVFDKSLEDLERLVSVIENDLDKLADQHDHDLAGMISKHAETDNTRETLKKKLNDNKTGVDNIMVQILACGDGLNQLTLDKTNDSDMKTDIDDKTTTCHFQAKQKQDWISDMPRLAHWGCPSSHRKKLARDSMNNLYLRHYHLHIRAQCPRCTSSRCSRTLP